MKKKIIALILISLLTFSLCSCTRMFSKDFFSVIEYTDSSYNQNREEAKTVSNWNELKNAVRDMVGKHITEGELIFSEYGGDLQKDLSQVGSSVKLEDALADYCVDYISYDLNHIVKYYEAQIHIAYKRTANEVNSIVPVAGLSGFKKQVKESLGKYDTNLYIQWYSKGLTEEDVSTVIQEVYLYELASSVVSPSPNISVHSSATAKNIVEIVFNYGYTDTALRAMKAELKRKTDSIVSSFDTEDFMQFTRDACKAINSSCEYIEHSPDDEEVPRRSTAYSALIDGHADSLGMALAFSTLCNAGGFESIVQAGTLNNISHYWNVICIDGKYSHVDVTNHCAQDNIGVFIHISEQMRNSGYVWDETAYTK